ncbi:hypothetical protein T4D_14031 [Trichinella pseudospiralis]|uniref:Uncharacterized protein n=1 Tax=Trichinella pseudospiralis TaxID=6337 RepID=A0A0V1FMK1_TRIPS|nr:hypothetical protein T4D_14031 [Trichinella pseudospiralis]
MKSTYSNYCKSLHIFISLSIGVMKNFNPMCMIVSSVTRFTLFNNIKFEIPHELPELKDEENEKSSEYSDVRQALRLLIICISNVSQVRDDPDLNVNKKMSPRKREN